MSGREPYNVPSRAQNSGGAMNSSVGGNSNSNPPNNGRSNTRGGGGGAQAKAERRPSISSQQKVQNLNTNSQLSANSASFAPGSSTFNTPALAPHLSGVTQNNSLPFFPSSSSSFVEPNRSNAAPAFISATATPFTPNEENGSSDNTNKTNTETNYMQDSLYCGDVLSGVDLGFLYHLKPLLAWKVLHGVRQVLSADVPEGVPQGQSSTALFSGVTPVTPSFVDTAFQRVGFDPSLAGSHSDEKMAMPLQITGTQTAVPLLLPTQMSLLSASLPISAPVIDFALRPREVTLGYKHHKPQPLRLHNVTSAKNNGDNAEPIQVSSDGKSLEMTAQGETRLVDWAWSRGVARKCRLCGKEATLQCLASVKARYQVDQTLFCSMTCVRENLQKQKARIARVMGLATMPSASEGGVQKKVVGGEWFDDVDEHDALQRKQTLQRQQTNQARYNTAYNADFVQTVTANGTAMVNGNPYVPGAFTSEGAVPLTEDAPLYSWGCYEAVCTKFPAPFEDSYTFVSSELKYTPRTADLHCSLRLDMAPAIVVDPTVIGTGKNKLAFVDPSFVHKWRSIITKPVQDVPAPVPPRKRLVSNRKLGSNYQPGFSFKVMHYNVLSDVLASPTMYTYCPPYALTWAYRSMQIIQEILSCDADIVCLQEVDACHFEFFQAELRKAGYVGEFLAKAKYYEADGCATFFKQSKFCLTGLHYINYDELIMEYLVGVQKVSNEPMNLLQRRYLRGNVALALLLEPVNGYGSQQAICVTNTHIFWDPKFPDVKLLQVWHLMTELSNIFPRTPLIISGDFNSTPDSSLYEFLLTRSVREESLNDIPLEYLHNLPTEAELTHTIPLKSAYAHVKAQVLSHYPVADGFIPSMEPQFTNYTKTFKGTLDYILFSSELVCHEVLDIDEESVLSEHVALPSHTKPSDHISLVAVFELPFVH